MAKGNKKTLALTEEQLKLIINTIRNGFRYTDKNGKEKFFRPNDRIATILNLEANLGIRISDILNLRFKDIVRDGDRYRLEIVEKKTGKSRTFTVINDIYRYIEYYKIKNKISDTAKLFDICEYAVQKQLKIAADYLKISGVGTHSFRKFFATQVYKDSGYNIQMVRVLLQHSNITTTQKYIGIQSEELEKVLTNHNFIV